MQGFDENSVSKIKVYGRKGKRVQTCTASWNSKGDGIRKAPLRNSQRRFKVAATYSPTTQCSTIGDAELNDPVRNGKGWDLSAITT